MKIEAFYSTDGKHTIRFETESTGKTLDEEFAYVRELFKKHMIEEFGTKQDLNRRTYNPKDKDPNWVRGDGKNDMQPKKECPTCGADMEVRSGKYGPFWSCTNYPTCDQKGISIKEE